MYNNTEKIVFDGYFLEVHETDNGYYASLMSIYDNSGCYSLYIRSDSTISTSMGLSNGKFGYCETLNQIKYVVKHLFPYHYDNIDYSKLEN